MKSISREEYVAAAGLLKLAHHHVQQIREIERATANLLGVSPDSTNYFGHVTDAVQNPDTSVNELLDDLEVSVEGGRPPML